MMEKSKFKSGVSGKGKTIAGAAMTLAAAAVLTMAPMSQAFAKISYRGYATLENATWGKPGWKVIIIRGHGPSQLDAKGQADVGAGVMCRPRVTWVKGKKVTTTYKSLGGYFDPRTWHNGTWFNYIAQFECPL